MSKTYLAALAMILVAGLIASGSLTSDQALALVAGVAGLGMASLRHGVAKAERAAAPPTITTLWQEDGNHAQQ